MYKTKKSSQLKQNIMYLDLRFFFSAHRNIAKAMESLGFGEIFVSQALICVRKKLRTERIWPVAGHPITAGKVTA